MATAFKKVELGGKEYLLKFGFNAIADIEEYFGKGVGAVFNKEQMGFRTIRAMYWAGLHWKYKNLTIEKVGELLEEELENTDKTLQDIMKPIVEAISKAKMFKKVENKADEEATDEEDPN